MRCMSRRVKNLLLAVLAGLCLASGARGLSLEYILVLNSYHPGYTWSDDELAGVRDGLKAELPEYEIVVEYLDTKHFPGQAHYPEWRALLQKKYGHHRPALVLALDDPALDFVRQSHTSLFPAVPAVYCGINADTPPVMNDPLITGILQTIDPAGTLDQALWLQPELTEIFVVNDLTSTGLANRKLIEGLAGRYAGRLSFRYSGEVSGAELAEAVRALPPTAAVLLMSFAGDRQGRMYTHGEAARLLASAAPVPVFAVQSECLGHGIVGGMLLDGRAHGASAANYAARVLRGVSPATLPPRVAATAIPMFDDQVLRRHRLDAGRLGPGAVIINRPPASLWVVHRQLLAAILTVIAGLLVLVAILSTNIVRRRRAEAELRTLDELKTNLLSNVSHELRTPLVAIRGYTELISEGTSGPVTETQRRQLGVVLRNSDRLLELIDNLLQFSKHTFEKQSVQLQPCNLIDVAREGVAIALPRAQSAGLNLSGELPDSSVILTADPRQLLRVVTNLLDNAIKFTPSGGRITLAVRPEKDRVVLTVTDTGIGIPPEAQPRLFDRFYQVESGSTRSYGGTGLGLAITREIVGEYGGTITIASDPGAGTTVTVTLPLA